MLLAFAVPFLTAPGIEGRAAAPLLAIYGAACLAGNVVGGPLADRGLRRSLIDTLAGTAIALLIAGTVKNCTVGAIVEISLVGVTYYTTFPALNIWIATSAEGIAPGLALAVNNSAFNICIAVAGGVGGAVLSAGLEATKLPYLGAGALAIGAAISILLRAPRSPQLLRLVRATRD